MYCTLIRTCSRDIVQCVEEAAQIVCIVRHVHAHDTIVRLVCAGLCWSGEGEQVLEYGGVADEVRFVNAEEDGSRSGFGGIVLFAGLRARRRQHNVAVGVVQLRVADFCGLSIARSWWVGSRCIRVDLPYFSY